MPFVSVIVIAAFVYIGMTGQLVGLAEVLAAISSFALLLVNIAVLFIYNRLQKLDEEHAVLQMSKCGTKRMRSTTRCCNSNMMDREY